MFPNHWQNQTRTHFSARSDSGMAMIRGDFTTITWRKSETLSQSDFVVAKLLAFSLALSSLLLSVLPPSLVTLSSSYSTKFSSSSSVPFTEMHFANTFRRLAADFLPSKMEASDRNGGRNMAFSVT